MQRCAERHRRERSATKSRQSSADANVPQSAPRRLPTSSIRLVVVQLVQVLVAVRVACECAGSGRVWVERRHSRRPWDRSSARLLVWFDLAGRPFCGRDPTSPPSGCRPACAFSAGRLTSESGTIEACERRGRSQSGLLAEATFFDHAITADSAGRRRENRRSLPTELPSWPAASRPFRQDFASSRFAFVVLRSSAARMEPKLLILPVLDQQSEMSPRTFVVRRCPLGAALSSSLNIVLAGRLPRATMTERFECTASR